MAKKNTRKNNVRDEAALDLAAIAEAMNNGGFHGGEETHVVAAPIMIMVMDEDVAALLTDDVLDVIVPADEAQAKRDEAFSLKRQAKGLMEERAALDVERLTTDFRYYEDKAAATRKAVREGLFTAQDGQISKAADLLKGNPKYDGFMAAINARVETILNRDHGKLMEDLELSRMMLGEAEAKSAELLRKANELGVAANKLFDESIAILKSIGTTIKPFVKEAK